jgi:hypothetical protein
MYDANASCRRDTNSAQEVRTFTFKELTRLIFYIKFTSHGRKNQLRAFRSSVLPEIIFNISHIIQQNILVKFKVLTAANNKTTTFWDTAPCSLVEADVRTVSVIRAMFKTTAKFSPLPNLHSLFSRFFTHRPDDGSRKYVRNVGQLLQDYTAQYPRTLSPWEKIL